MMPRIKPVDPKLTDTTMTATLTAVEAKLGMLPNLFTTIAQSPASLDSYLYVSEALAKGKLTSKQREMIAITVAQENECEYCLSAHTAIGKSVGLSDAVIKAAREGGSSDALDDAIVKFALKIVRFRGAVSDADIAEFRSVNNSDGIIIEIITNVVLNIMTNYVNRLAGTDVDFPHVSLATVA